VAQVTKYRCDFCKKEVEDTYLEAGWIHITGTIARSWGERARGRDGDGRADFIGNNPEFCCVECLVAALDAYRKEHKGPDPQAGIAALIEPDDPLIAVDPFKEPPKPKPWEEPPVLAEDEPVHRAGKKKSSA